MNVLSIFPVGFGPCTFIGIIIYHKMRKRTVFDVKSITRPNIYSLTPYRCARDDYSEGILLDANENSIGAAVEENRELSLNRYPDPLFMNIKKCIGAYRGVAAEEIFLGVGSDEAIDILFRIFCRPGVDNVVICPPTYGMYKVCAQVNDVHVKRAPLTPTFELDVEGTLAEVDAYTKMIFVCSPGNPTARAIPVADIAMLCDIYKTGIVVVDEAYVDFSAQESATVLLKSYDNVVVLQTLSKAFGMAGIRVGMAIADKAIIRIMNNVKAPYNLNKLSAAAALNVFERRLPTVQRFIDEIITEREHLSSQLKTIPFVQTVYPSDTNFILFVVEKAEAIYTELAARGVVVRYRGNELHCRNCIRITVGTRNENRVFLDKFREVAADMGVAP